MNIGIAIINTDRPECLSRLLKSIEKYTDSHILNNKIIISDDSKNVNKINSIISKFSFTTLQHNGERIGVAKNTNFAMSLLKDKDICFIFNNDCEILQTQWIDVYVEAMEKTKIHHFCFQQEGIWGAGTHRRPETKSVINNIEIKTLYNYPQGALLIYDSLAFQTVGYFDSLSFTGYGKSHWDWSNRVSESGIQLKGFHDIIGSNKYIRVHDEPSVTEAFKRAYDYKKNTSLYEELVKKLKNKTRSLYKGFYDG